MFNNKKIPEDMYDPHREYQRAIEAYYDTRMSGHKADLNNPPILDDFFTKEARAKWRLEQDWKDDRRMG